MEPKLVNKLIIVLIIAIGIYASFLLVLDFSIIYDKIVNFKTAYLPIILVIVSCSWLVLFLRWTILLKNLKIYLPTRSSLLIYVSSFSLSATPGQIGELIKSQLLKNKFNIPMTKTAPLVFIERLYDLTGALFVSILGIWFLGIGIYVIIAASIVLAVIFILLRSQTAFDKTLLFLQRIKFLKKTTDILSNSQDTIQQSITGKTAFLSIVVSIAYWFLIGVAAYLVMLALDIDVLEYLNIVSIYSSSLILGAASFVPGGIGITEGSIAGLLTLGGVDVASAFVIGIIIRIFTLWYAVFVGFIALKINGGLTSS
ncbi:lysylphosphatidylglycerol synthase transmembrane domain-containing protein [Candidatus Nitrosotenuis cloacae]|uniref:lysylphosphatidylglycerol synthase transmembrane domain-containing protein n=1 Tax=Candidatus Nitrosotenuis cloacae TaxID=1603555 RepID=UPI0022802DB0|nr:lysylphosphatidylglycerol synthase transmembrane domain-containing protein [Candidatus Nitrosotenuis cloacae]